MKALRALLRRLVLTRDERVLLDADRSTVLRAMLDENQRLVLDAMNRPLPLPENVNFTQEELDGWRAVLASPVGIKVDATMNGWLAQQAHAAIAAPTAEIVAHAKFAWGCRAGWEMAKTLSRMAAAEGSESEETAVTGGDLAQHNP